MTIRDATLDDIPVLLEWGRHFADACNLPGGYDEESARVMFASLIESDNGILLIGDGGAIAGVICTSPYNHAHKTGQELFWWVEPEKRRNGLGVALLAGLEAAAIAAGAQSWAFSTIGLDDGRLGQLYESMGYRLTDRNYSKVF